MIMTIGWIKFFDRLYTILQKNGGTDTKPMGKTEPQFLSDPMSDGNFFFRQLCYRMFGIIVTSDFVRKALISHSVFNFILKLHFTPFIHFRFQPNPFVKTITIGYYFTTDGSLCLLYSIHLNATITMSSQWRDVFHTTIDL
jgi:hypothetical protein